VGQQQLGTDAFSGTATARTLRWLGDFKYHSYSHSERGTIDLGEVFLICDTWQFRQVFIHNMVIYNKQGLSRGSFSFNFGSHGMLVQSFVRTVFLWSQEVESASILNGVEHHQCIVGQAPTVDVSESDWMDLGSGSHGSSVRNGRSRVISFRDRSDLSETVGNTVSRVRLF